MFNPEIHHRQSIRLRDFDYSTNGAYFVTICTEGRECRFVGANPCVRPEFDVGEMALNEAGRMITEWWLKLPGKFSHVSVDEYVIMPDHFHGIIILHDADRRGEPMCSPAFDVGLPAGDQIQNLGEHGNLGEHVVRPYGTMENSLGRVMQAFKTMTTNAYIRGVNDKKWPPFPGRLWQRNYYERIIRDEKELASITEYIAMNPMRWAEDRRGEPMCSPGFYAPTCSPAFCLDRC